MWLGLSASLLAGGTARFPQLLPGPGHNQPSNTRTLKALYGIQKRVNIPFTGWRANPVLGAMQEPIPDLSFIIGTHKELKFNGHNIIHVFLKYFPSTPLHLFLKIAWITRFSFYFSIFTNIPWNLISYTKIIKDA
jgi:hypothetical protein